MTGHTVEVTNIVSEDSLARDVSALMLDWDGRMQEKKEKWREILEYLYATDTTQTSNSHLPWKNKTTIPKLCQINDSLYANYKATLDPQRKSVTWEANERDANSRAKRDAIVNYMSWVIEQPQFKHELDKIILDYIQYGNCFVTVDWVDHRVELENGSTQFGYVGPVPKRISPNDIRMNPVAENFFVAPKVIRSLISIGELKEILTSLSVHENKEEYLELYEYLKELRHKANTYNGDWVENDHLYKIDGFASFRDYLQSNTVELLTFYGDIYDCENDVYLKNHVITVVDRHKLIGKKPNPSFFGYPPIFHAPWRKRQDNLWGMGPLDNLIGMQYRLDHVENMKADIFDLVTYPVQKVKGFVEDYTWQPGEKIFVDAEGDVDMIVPDVNALQANFELQNLERMMEEMAGAPKEALGFRTPGEKTKYEVQRLENAAARVFQNKIKQFEEQVIEPLLNAMLELARRNLTGATVIKVFDDENKAYSFESLTVEDILGVGRIRPLAARHFAEEAELVQNLTNLTNSQLWPTVQPHFSGIKLAKIFEKVFKLEDFEVVIPNIALVEQAEAQKQAQALEEQLQQHTMTASGIGSDFDIPPEAQADPAQIAQMAQAQAQG